MPREFQPILLIEEGDFGDPILFVLGEEHEGQRFWIVPDVILEDANLKEKKKEEVSSPWHKKKILYAKPVPEDMKDEILLVSGVFKGRQVGSFSNSRYLRPIFADFWNKDGKPVETIAGIYPEEKETGGFLPESYGGRVNPIFAGTVGDPYATFKLRTFYYYEPKEIGALATSVPRDIAMEVLGVTEDLLQEDAEDAGGAVAPYTRERRIITDRLLDTLITGGNESNIEEIFQSEPKPDLSVVRQMRLSFTAEANLVPKRGIGEKKNYFYRTLWYEKASMFKDCIGLLMDNESFSEDKKKKYCQFFLLNGADPSVSLTLAVANRNLTFVQMLLDAGADPNTVTKYFWKQYKTKLKAYYTCPLKAIIQVSMVLTSYDKYYRIDTGLHRDTKKRTIEILKDLLKGREREFVEKDGKLVMRTIEPFVSEGILEELKGRLEDHMKETERIKILKDLREEKGKAGLVPIGNITDEVVPTHDISFYIDQTEALTYMLEDIEQVSFRQRCAPISGRNLFNKAKRNALELGCGFFKEGARKARKSRKTRKTIKSRKGRKNSQRNRSKSR